MRRAPTTQRRCCTSSRTERATSRGWQAPRRWCGASRRSTSRWRRPRRSSTTLIGSVRSTTGRSHSLPRASRRRHRHWSSPAACSTHLSRSASHSSFNPRWLFSTERRFRRSSDWCSALSPRRRWSACLSDLGVPIIGGLVLTGSLLRFLPGYALVSGFRDLIGQSMISGTARLAEALLLGAGVAGGTAIGVALAALFGVDLSLVTTGAVAWGLVVTLPAAFVAVGAFAVRLGVPPSAIVGASLLGAFAWWLNGALAGPGPDSDRPNSGDPRRVDRHRHRGPPAGAPRARSGGTVGRSRGSAAAARPSDRGGDACPDNRAAHCRDARGGRDSVPARHRRGYGRHHRVNARGDCATELSIRPWTS